MYTTTILGPPEALPCADELAVEAGCEGGEVIDDGRLLLPLPPPPQADAPPARRSPRSMANARRIREASSPTIGAGLRNG